MALYETYSYYPGGAYSYLAPTVNYGKILEFQTAPTWLGSGRGGEYHDFTSTPIISGADELLRERWNELKKRDHLTRRQRRNNDTGGSIPKVKEHTQQTKKHKDYIMLKRMAGVLVIAVALKIALG